MTPIWQTLFNGLALITIVVVAWDTLGGRTARFSPRTQSVFLGLIMGGGAIASMVTAQPIASGFIFDLRAPLVAASAFFGGLPAVLVATAMAAAFRLYLGGQGTVLGVFNILVAAALGLFCHWVVRAQQKTMVHVFGFGIAIGLCAFFGLLPAEVRGDFFSRAVVPYSSLAFVSSVMIGTLLFREQKRRELTRMNMIYRAMVRELPDPLNVKNVDGRFVAANPATATLMRAGSAEELVGKTDFDYYPKDVAERFRVDEIGMLESGEIQRVDQRALLAGDVQIWLSTLKAPIRDDTGKIIGIITYNRDISDQKRIAQLKNEFISTVSHELRTPLTSIRGSLGLIAAGVTGRLPAKAANLVRIAHSNSERLVLLINDILDMEKIESGKTAFEVHSMRLRPLVEQAIAASANYMPERRIRLLLVDDAPRAEANVDPDRMHQVLTNLLSNAIKFSPLGETVTVRIACRESNALRISVIDRGSGIPETFRSRIFGKFEQADASSTRDRGGTGLGLSIAKTIVERLSGTISFDTEVGAGTAFHVDLPLIVSTAASAWGHQSAPFSNRRRVLIVEDDADVAKVLAALLDADGFCSDVAPDIGSAKTLLETRHYVALTLDIRLADETGTTLFRDIGASPTSSDIPVIVISAVADEAKRKLSGSAIGIVDWLEKPVDPARLHAAMGKIVVRAEDRRPSILHVEDDESVLAAMSEGLGAHATVISAKNLKEARTLVANNQFNLVILDISLPNGSGIDLLAELPLGTAVIVFSGVKVDQKLGSRVRAVMTKTKASELDVAKLIKSFLPAEPALQ